MLDVLRKHSRSTMIYLLFGVIIVVFIFTFNTTGQSGDGCGGAVDNPEIASVGSHTITEADVRMGLALSVDAPRSAADSLNYTRTRFSRYDEFMKDPDQISLLETEKVVDELVETYLVSDAALEMGFGVSDEELSEAIIQQLFPADAEFDEESYTRYVRYGLKTTKAEFENFTRRELLRRKFIDYLTAFANPDPTLVDYYFKQMNEKVVLSYVDVDPKVVAEVIEVSDEDAQKFAGENAEKIKTYYDEHPAEFKKAERVRLRGIFKTAPFLAQIEREEDATRKTELETQRSDAKTKIYGVLAQLGAEAAPALPAPVPTPDSGAAPAPSEGDPTAADAVPAEEAPVEPAAVAPTEGDQAGQPAAVDAAVAPDGGEQAEAAPAQGDPAAAPAEGEQAEAAPAQGDPAAAAAVEPEQAESPTDAAGAPATPQPTEPAKPAEDIFAKVASTESDRDSATGGLIAEPKTKDELNVWPYGPEVAEAVFKLEPGQRTEVVEVSGGFWILRVEEKLPAFEKSLEDSKVEIARKLLQQERAVAKAQEFAQEILDAAKADTAKSLTDIVTEWNARHPVAGKENGVLSASETAPFARMSPGTIPRTPDMEGFVPGLGKAPEIIDAAFKLSAENPVGSQVHKLPDTDRVLVIRFKEKIDPTEEEAKTQRNLLKRELATMTKVQTYLAWYRSLLNDAQKNGDVELTGAYHDLVTEEKQLIEARNAPTKQSVNAADAPPAANP